MFGKDDKTKTDDPTTEGAAPSKGKGRSFVKYDRSIHATNDEAQYNGKHVTLLPGEVAEVDADVAAYLLSNFEVLDAKAEKMVPCFVESDEKAYKKARADKVAQAKKRRDKAIKELADR